MYISTNPQQYTMTMSMVAKSGWLKATRGKLEKGIRNEKHTQLLLQRMYNNKYKKLTYI